VIEFGKRGCAVCGSAESRTLFRQTFAQASEGMLLRGYDVVVCTECGFGYADRVPEQSEFDAYYEQMSRYEFEYRGGEQSDFEARRFPVAANFIRALLPEPVARILDVGCSNGGLLQALRQVGYTNVMGLDPSAVCVQTTGRLYGIPAVAGTLSSLPPHLGYFDLVILSAVLEHVRDLRTALIRARSLLRPGSLLYVEVPDVTRFACSSDAPFQEFSVEHINYFSVLSLRNLLGAEGFEMVEHARTETMQGTFVSAELKAMFRLTEEARGLPAEYDAETERVLTEYIHCSRGVEARIHAAIDPWVRSRKAIIIWGVGTHTQRLLATSALASANISAFVDSNQRYQGKLLNGLPILPPEALRERSEPILISSRFFQEEIKNQIRDGLGLNNELILLYDV